MADVLQAARDALADDKASEREKLIAMGVLAMIEDASKLVELAEADRDDARANARILAHSWEHDGRPPARAVKAALAYPAISDRMRKLMEERR